jgi:citrate synthase
MSIHLFSEHPVVEELMDTMTQFQSPELPLLHPTIGPPMVDIRSLHRRTGNYAYDPGLGETGICRSAITYVDGDNGILLYRGYPIEELVESCSYLEI